MAFPLDALDMHVEVKIDGAWEDLGSGPGPLGPDIRVVAEPITISEGRQDEGSRVQPGQWTVTLWNDDGLLSPIPESDWWRTDGTGWDLGSEMRVRVGSSVQSHGEISSIEILFPEGDLSVSEDIEWGGEDADWGGDAAGFGSADSGISFVEVTVSGISRRGGQRTKPLRSCLYRAVTSPAHLPHVYDYCPMEDGRDGSVMASGMPNENRPWMTFAGELSLASDSDLGGSEPLPTIPEGKDASWFASVTGFTDEGVIEGFFRFPERPNNLSTIVRLVDVYGTGDIARFNVEVFDAAGVPEMRVTAYDSDSAVLEQSIVTLYFENVFFQPGWLQYRLTFTESGGSTTWDLQWWTVTRNADPGAGVSDTWTGTLGHVHTVGGAVAIAPPKGISIGHLIVHDGVGAGWLVGPDVGMFGEEARNRINRLCIEENYPCIFFGGADTRSMPLGIQRPMTLPDLLEECETADRGLLFEDRKALQFKYLHLRARYNKSPSITLDAAGSEIANPLRPVRDDQTIRNDVTATRQGGVSVRQYNSDSITRFGVYDEQLTVNAASDLIVRHVAGWQLRLGDDHGLRVSQLTIDLAIAPHLSGTWGAMEPGKIIRVVNLPPQLSAGPLDLIYQGGNQTLEPYARLVVANCTPAAPFTIARWGESLWDDPSSILGL